MFRKIENLWSTKRTINLSAIWIWPTLLVDEKKAQNNAFLQNWHYIGGALNFNTYISMFNFLNVPSIYTDTDKCPHVDMNSIMSKCYLLLWYAKLIQIFMISSAVNEMSFITGRCDMSMRVKLFEEWIYQYKLNLLRVLESIVCKEMSLRK